MRANKIFPRLDFTSLAPCLATRFGLAVALGTLLTSAGAQEKALPVSSASTNASFRQIGPGLFELGNVRLEQQQRTITFPAMINQREGAIEYLLVTTYGKTHESLLRTEAAPLHVHLAFLLLGAHGAGTNLFPQDHREPLPGEPVIITLNWTTAGKEERHSVDEFVSNLETKSLMTAGPWVYNGSSLYQGVFLAQDNGSIVSVMEDPDALINNPRPGRENDKIWQVNPQGLPPLNTPVQVTFKLERTNQKNQSDDRNRTKAVESVPKADKAVQP